jgi:hypothetical protein
MSSTLLEYAILGGLAKVLLRYGWRRLTAARGWHRGARRIARLCLR